MRVLIVLTALLAVGCGSSSTAPTAPILPASLTAQGTLSVTSCFAGTNGLFTCSGYSGTALNTGTGCAANVRGVTTTFDATTRAQTGTSGWTYAAMVKPGEQFAYTGTTLVLQGPLVGGWAYTSSISWDAVRCP